MKHLLGVILIMLLGSQNALAQDLPQQVPAASDEALHWLLLPTPPKAVSQTSTQTASEDVEQPKLPPYQILLNMTDRDQASQWAGITQLRGDLQPTSLAAVGHDLYVVLGSSQVYCVQRQEPPPGTMLRDVIKMVVQPKLPVEGQVISAIANDKGYHIILEPKLTVERLVDEKQTPEDSRLLLKLYRNKWTQSPLPDAVLDWQQLHLITTGSNDQIAYAGVADGQLVMTAMQDEHWQTQQLDFTVPMHARLHWLNINGHHIAAMVDSQDQQLTIALHLIVGDQTLALGDFQIPEADLKVWTLLAMGEKVGLIMQNATNDQLTLQTLDLQGDQLEEPIVITVGNPVNDLNQPGRWIVLAAMMAGMLVLFSVWRRDPATAKVTVPQGYQIAAVSKRFLALMIDLAPCGMISSYFFDITMQQLVDQWPGVAITWEQLMPGLVTIAIYITHTTVSEIFTAQTVGKKIMGISVCTMDGQSPDVWQVILRNLLKTLDLIAWYALPFLVIVSAYRQRLGDIVARTVVIQPKLPDIEE
ncbi:MAG: RDD family protein [Phycisphaeraceae bacterium JB051]